MENKNEIVRKEKKPLTASERFTNKVMTEFSALDNNLELTNFQRTLVQNYFIYIDSALKKAEQKRNSSKNKLAYTWENVNMNKLALDVIHNARLSLDPLLPNHIDFIPYNNSSLKKYDLTPILGYRGLEIKHTRYGVNVPDNIIFELVYSKDKFKSYRKDRNNKFESYEFNIENEFDRGDIVGGFAYFEYEDHFKNKLHVLKLDDILKRKPQYASPEFWGGEKDKWVNGKKDGTITLDGWFPEMCMKTLKRFAYSKITIDSTKIDSTYQHMKKMELENSQLKIQNEIEENANSKVIDIDVANPKEIPEYKPENTQELPEPEKPESNISDKEHEELSKPSVLDDLQPDF